MNDITIPIFSYGILRKKGLLKSFLSQYGLKEVRVVADYIEGYVPYNSGQINFVFPVNNKQKKKHKDADFMVRGSLLFFSGSKSMLKELYNDIDRIEAGYQKTIITTKGGQQAYVYFMDNAYKRFYDYTNISHVVYPDSILDDETIKNEHTADIYDLVREI